MPATKRNRWSIVIFCTAQSGERVDLFSGRFPSLHDAATAVDMTYAQLNAMHRKGTGYGPHKIATKWSPTFDVFDVEYRLEN